RRQLGAALFTPNGVAGLVFYLALVLLVADGMMLHTGATGGWWYVPFLVVLPLVLMYFQQPLIQLVDTGKVHIESVFDLLVGGFFEMFVTLLEYLANTVSFLRVGGFVLAHAGMMSVVLTLANMAGAGPLYYVVMAFGNIFVICLEGLIVGIQALRLNYYEVFSRFYEADGEPFEPLVLVPDTTVL
ncbi:MAG: V-type ATPase 116kDa subunit family protein, partial [Oscillospiraceae bacterium]